MTDIFVISYEDAPRSINHGGLGSRGHWSQAHREKSQWEGIFAMLLIERKVPRKMLACTCEGLIEWRTANRRDPENYRPALVKPLADALVKGGWLPDDTADYFEFGRLMFSHGLDHPNRQVKSRTTVRIEADYERT